MHGSSSLCPILYADSPKCQFMIAHVVSLLVCKRESSVFSVVTGLIADAFLLLFFICNTVKRAERG